MTTPTAPPAPPATERFSVIEPNGLDLDALLARSDADPDAPDPSAGTAAAPAAPAPATALAAAPTPPVPVDGKGKLVPLSDLIQERRKRQGWASAYTELLARSEAEQRARSTQALAQPIEFSEPELAEMEKNANAAENMGQVVRMIAGAFTAKTKVAEGRRVSAHRQADVKRDEDAFRKTHDDYDEIITKSGISIACQINPATGLPNDPVIARDIYSHPNPVQRAYELGTGALTIRGELPSGDEEPTTTEPAAPAAAAPAAPAPGPAKPAAPAAAAPAEPNGVTPPSHPRGVGGLPPSGGGRTRELTRQDLDRIMEGSYDKYLELIKDNPRLEQWHMGAIDRL